MKLPISSSRRLSGNDEGNAFIRLPHKFMPIFSTCKWAVGRPVAAAAAAARRGFPGGQSSTNEAATSSTNDSGVTRMLRLQKRTGTNRSELH